MKDDIDRLNLEVNFLKSEYARMTLILLSLDKKELNEDTRIHIAKLRNEAKDSTQNLLAA